MTKKNIFCVQVDEEERYVEENFQFPLNIVLDYINYN